MITMKLGDIFEKIEARQILNSRGHGAVEVDLSTNMGIFRASVASGASTGSKEAVEITDKTDLKGVEKAIFNIKKIIEPSIAKLNIKLSHQSKFDDHLIELDGTKNKKRLGANAILPVSMAFARAGAASKNMTMREHLARISGSTQRLPRPFFNVINGGMHSGNRLKFQEIMISFKHDTFRKDVEDAALFYHKLKRVISNRYGQSATGVGDEGGFAPPISTLEEGLELIMETYDTYKFEKMEIAIDAAANSFFSDGIYDIGDRRITGEDLVEYYDCLAKKYKLIKMIEDPFEESDYENWQKLYSRLKGNVRIVGDDLTVTNVEMIQKAIDMKLCDTLLVKLNQIGTVSEAIRAIKLAESDGMHIMVSHRSGETVDTFMCDFSVGLGAEYIKAGAPCRGERTEKYNQLLRIEAALEK